jgi:hypothetical protein
MANYGQAGNPKPTAPPVSYPASSTIRLDLINTGSSSISNLTFYWRGVKLFPPGSVPSYTYPRRFSSNYFEYPLPILHLGFAETRLNQLFTVKTDADFVLRAAQSNVPFIIAGSESPSRIAGDVFFRLRDHTKNPYSNDFVAFDVLFGSADYQARFPAGNSFVNPFGVGPTSPGLWCPEIYVPANQQLWYDVQRTDGPGDGMDVQNQAEDALVNFIGAKVYPK